MNENSRGQITLVTGAGSGFGRITAIELARRDMVRAKSSRSALLLFRHICRSSENDPTRLR